MWKVSGRCLQVVKKVLEGIKNHNCRLGIVTTGVARTGQIQTVPFRRGQARTGQVRRC